MNAHTKMWFACLYLGLVICLTFGTESDISLSQGMEDEQKGIEEESQEPQPVLPVDTSPRLIVRELSISGNTLISTEDLLKNMPSIYNASNQALLKAQSQYLYDISVFGDILSQSGQPHEVSTRTIEGFRQYILSEYQAKNYAGIYVYTPKETISEDMELVDGILVIRVIEAQVGEVSVKYSGVDPNEIEEGYLRRWAIEQWSPVKTGKVADQRALDYFVNLLNLNPDRHVSVIVSQGAEPNTLDFQYDIYEADPWHYFIQVDNSGTDDRQWSPRIGIINTNLMGIDDRLTTVYQAKPDSTIDENYSIYGSYDVPVMGPKLRLNLYAGHSEFDISPESGPFNFLGRGTFYGALLRYNAYQKNGWFFDITGSISHERSKVTPSLFPSAAADVEMDLFGVGAEVHRSDDISNTSVSLNRLQSIDGSSRAKFELARTNSDPDFSIYTINANHNRYLDQDKIGQLRGNIKWITSDERLIPAKMTSFGGMYSVRGYDEYEIVADGGILASIQYEFDWLRYETLTEPEQAEIEEGAEQEQEQPEEETETTGLVLTKLSPLVFIDFGRSDIKDAVIGETENQTLWSIGIGSAFELGQNLSGAVYYGYPMKATDDTRKGKGRLNVSFMLRW